MSSIFNSDGVVEEDPNNDKLISPQLFGSNLLNNSNQFDHSFTQQQQHDFINASNSNLIISPDHSASSSPIDYNQQQHQQQFNKNESFIDLITTNNNNNELTTATNTNNYSSDSGGYSPPAQDTQQQQQQQQQSYYDQQQQQNDYIHPPSSPISTIYTPSQLNYLNQQNNNNNNNNNEVSITVQTIKDNIGGLFACYTPSAALAASMYMFQCTPTFYAAKKNQKIGIFLYHRSEINRLCVQHPALRVRLTSVPPYWTPSSFTRKNNKKNIEAIAPSQFETIETTLKKGEALFGPVRIQKTGFYFLKCTIDLSPIPTEEELQFKDFSFTFKIYFYGSPSKKRSSSSSANGSGTNNSSGLKDDDDEEEEEIITTKSNDVNVEQDNNDINSANPPSSISNINIRPNENLMNYISHLQETGARWKDLEHVFDIYYKKYDKNPEVLSELLVEQGIGSTFIGSLHDAQVQMDKGLDLFYSPENLFKVSYLKSAIFRIQKNFTASKLHLDTCDFLFKKIDLTYLHQGQYFFNKAAHEYDCLMTQRTKQNNYVAVRDQIVEKFKQAADFYAKDYENLSPNATTNARSINGTYRSNIRIAQTILGSPNLTENDLTRAESFLTKIPNIQSFTFTQRTQIHLLFTWADLMLAKSFHLFRVKTNNQKSFQMLAESLEFINKSSNYASKLGFNNEIRYTTDRYQKLYATAPPSFLNTLTGANIVTNQHRFIPPSNPTSLANDFSSSPLLPPPISTPMSPAASISSSLSASISASLAATLNNRPIIPITPPLPTTSPTTSVQSINTNLLNHFMQNNNNNIINMNNSNHSILNSPSATSLLSPLDQTLYSSILTNMQNMNNMNNANTFSPTNNMINSPNNILFNNNLLSLLTNSGVNSTLLNNLLVLNSLNQTLSNLNNQNQRVLTNQSNNNNNNNNNSNNNNLVLSNNILTTNSSSSSSSSFGNNNSNLFQNIGGLLNNQNQLYDASTMNNMLTNNNSDNEFNININNIIQLQQQQQQQQNVNTTQQQFNLNNQQSQQQTEELLQLEIPQEYLNYNQNNTF